MSTLCVTNMTSSPLPIPRRLSSIPTPILHENCSFSNKRDKKDLDFTPEPSKPRPRIQSISRCFKKSLFDGPKVVGGLDERSFLSTPGYSEQKKGTYFSQCFKVLKVMGEGSFGKVYKALDRATNVEYAIKVAQGYNSRSLQEVRKHEELPSQENCVTFHKAWEERKALHIQLELCDENLTTFLARNPNIPECEIWRILSHCLKGLQHFHSHGLIHMDIKPDNVFRHAGLYKLGDFGLTIGCNELNESSDVIEGDSQYLAPELLQGRGGMAADIFSLGISLLEIATDIELPNNGPPWQALRHGDIPPTDNISTSLRQVITSMMSKDPDQRPTAQQLLAHPLHRYYSWYNYVRDKGSSIVSGFWDKLTPVQAPRPVPESTDEDVFKDIVELDFGDDQLPDIPVEQVTPIVSRKSSFVTPTTPSWPVTPKQTTPSWPHSPHLSPVRSSHTPSHASLLTESLYNNVFESSTPIKSFFDDSKMCEGDSYFEKPSLIKRNLLDSFEDVEEL